MRITQRQVAIGMQTLLLAGTLAILIFQIITGDDLIPIITTIIGLAVGGTVLFLFWRGWALTSAIEKSATGAVPIRPNAVDPGRRPSKSSVIGSCRTKARLSTVMKNSGR